MEEQNKLLDKKIGTKEAPRNIVKPAKVTIASVVVQTKKKDGTSLKTPLANFMVKHPAKEELLSINKIKYLQDDKLIVKSFWVQLDEEENIQKGSTLSVLLSHLGCETLADTYGKQVDTVEESKESGFLCLKAY